MPRIFKYIVYFAAFMFAYAVFLYWVFPYGALKDRILGEIERNVGGVEVSAKSLEPYWFTGVDVEGLTISGPGEGEAAVLLKLGRVRARAAMLPLIFGSKRISFDVEIGKGEVSGSAVIGDEAIEIDVDVSDLDLSAILLIQARTGIKAASRIDGRVRLEINQTQPARSQGEILLKLDDLRLMASTVNLGEMTLEVPDLQIAKGKESQIKISVGKGTAALEEMRFANSDLGMDVKGKVFLSTKLENYRLNLKGAFTASQKLGEALPFLFIVDSQKQSDGSYPLTVTGRLGRPSIKIGTFTVPL